MEHQIEADIDQIQADQPEQKIQYSFTSEHQLMVDGVLFTEKKEKKSSEPGESQNVVHETHTQQIGDDKFITVKETMDELGNSLTDELTTETSKDLDIDSFKAEWSSGWKPVLNQGTESTGFFSRMKKALKFW